jgi:transposase
MGLLNKVYPIFFYLKLRKSATGRAFDGVVTPSDLVAVRLKGEKDLIAPMVFTVRLNAEGFEGWLSLYLLPSLTKPSILIMDNAPIHRKTAIRELVEETGHQVLFLPKYSPDLNDIEHDFSALKRARMYAPAGTSLDELICAYCAQ